MATTAQPPPLRSDYGPGMAIESHEPLSPPAPAATRLPLRILRSEGVVLFFTAVGTYFAGHDEPWWLVPLLLFVPDAFMAGYAKSRRVGALLYNFAHSYPAPAVLGMLTTYADEPLLQGVALVWFAHIGMDRALGYGLKYDTDFKDTHLGRIGAPRRHQLDAELLRH